MARLYSRSFTSRYAFAAGEDLVYSALLGESRRMPDSAARMIQSCNRFRTLEEHASSIGRQTGESPAVVIESLERWAKEGFLISDEQFVDHCKAAEAEGSVPPIATIGTTTRNRAGLLQRGLISFIESARTYGREHDYAVLDDGLTEQERIATRDALGAVVNETGAAVRYASRPDRESFAAALAAESGVDPAVTRFVLLGDSDLRITTGAARNSLLLDTVGDLWLLVDDDSVCRLARCPEPLPGIALDARTNPTELWFYADREAMLRETQFEPQDPLALHEAMLGRAISDCLRADNTHLDYTTADFAQRLWAHPGRVLATSGGVVGDSGMGSTAYLTLTPASQARLARSETDYIAAVNNRQILRTPLRSTIARGTFCVGASLGLDNRALLPPFVPVQRNSDGLFARTLLRCFRDGYKGYLPWAVLHDPLPPRTQTIEGAQADASRIRLTHILRALIVPQGFLPSSDPAVDLCRLGEELIEITSQKPGDFQHTIRPRIVKSAGIYLESIEQATRVDGAPEFYTRRQKQYWQQLSDALASGEYFVPRDLGEGDAEGVQRTAQSVVSRFGQVLRDWTAMMEGAKRLRQRGVRLAKPL